MADFIEHVRKLRVLMQNMITRVVVDRSENAGDYQVLWGGDRVTSKLEHLEPQGIHFRAARDAGGVVVNPGGTREGALLLVAGGIVPNDVISEGEGGLHFLATWKVFLAQDGTVHLGSHEAPDFVALASKVDAELKALRDNVDALVTAFNGHTHITTATIGAGATPGVIAPPASPATPPQPPSAVGSGVVRSE